MIPACASSSLAFRTMHSACKLNKQGDNTAFPDLEPDAFLSRFATSLLFHVQF